MAKQIERHPEPVRAQPDPHAPTPQQDLKKGENRQPANAGREQPTPKTPRIPGEKDTAFERSRPSYDDATDPSNTQH